MAHWGMRSGLHIFLLCLLSFSSVTLSANAPRQLRLAFAGPGGVSVSWTTATALFNAPAVAYGISPNALIGQAAGNSHTYGTSYFHDVVITGLAASTKYYYQVVLDPSSELSAVNSLVTARAAGDGSAYRVLVIGDMGITNSADTINAIIANVAQTDWIYHIGDISYADDFILELETY